MNIFKSIVTKIKNIFKKEKEEVIEEVIAEVKTEVEEKVSEVESKIEEKVAHVYEAFLSEFSGIHKMCLTIFLKQLCDRTKDRALDITSPNLKNTIHASFKFTCREVIKLYTETDPSQYLVDKTLIIAYFGRLVINKDAASAFIKDVILLAIEVEVQDKLEQLIHDEYLKHYA